MNRPIHRLLALTLSRLDIFFKNTFGSKYNLFGIFKFMLELLLLYKVKIFYVKYFMHGDGVLGDSHVNIFDLRDLRCSGLIASIAFLMLISVSVTVNGLKLFFSNGYSPFS
jgi:hypothetical protein